MGNSGRLQGAGGEAAARPLWMAGLLFLILLLPLALTPVVPAVDLNDHVLRHWILADNGATAALADNYTPRWALLSNLGMDILGAGLLQLVPPLPAAKLIAAICLFAPFAGALYLHRAVHGRLTLFALLLAGTIAFSHIFTWGFANFLLGLGLLLFGLGWWIRMAARPGLQLGGAILLGAVLIVVHALAFGLWGLMLGGVELAAAFIAGRPTLKGLMLRAARLVAVAVLPAVYFLSSRTAEAPQGVTAAGANVAAHAERGSLGARVLEEVLSRLDLLLRVSDTLNPMADRLLGGLMWVVILGGLMLGALRLAPVLRVAAALAFLLALVIPPNLFGSGYVNDRMPLLLMALLVGGLSVRPASRHARVVTAAAALVLVAHLALVATSYARAGAHFRDFRVQVAGVPLGRTAAPLHFTGAGRSENLPLCSPLLPLLAFDRLVAVPTFATPSQQPLELDGPLQAAGAARSAGSPRAERMKDAGLTDPAARAERIRRQFAFGYDSVVACDAAPPVPSGGGIVQVAHGPGWAVYRPVGE